MAGSAKAAGPALRYMAAGWAAFTGTHYVMSHPPVREQLIETLGGEDKYRGVYSAVAMAAFLPTTIIYVRSGRGMGVIGGWTNMTLHNPAVRALGFAAKAGAAVTFGQALATPNNMEKLMSGHKEEVDAEPRGIFRITRHPMFTAFALLGLGNILLRGYAGDVVYWGGWVLNWAVGCPHQDARLKAAGLIPSDYYNRTSFLPFAAIAAGHNSLEQAFKEFNKPVLITALAVPIFWL